MEIRLKPLIVNLAIPLAVGGLSALLSGGGMAQYQSMVKPPLSPPGWLFPIVWTVLYILMGISAYLIYTSDADKDKIRSALTVYGVQLAFNFVWPLLFFGLESYLTAFIWLILLWLLIIVTIILFFRISKPAAYLLIPYLLWVTFAAYLNFAAYLLN